jgi:hypothetical protein
MWSGYICIILFFIFQEFLNIGEALLDFINFLFGFDVDFIVGLLATFCPTMMIDSSTSCRNVCAIQEIMAAVPERKAAGRLIKAMPANMYAQYMLPTALVIASAIFS